MQVWQRISLVAGAAFGLLASPAFAQTAFAQTAFAQTQAPASPPAPAAAPSPAPAAGNAAAPQEPAKRMPSPPGAYVYIGWPNDGEVIRSTHFKVWFGTRNFGVAPAGTEVPNTGHHHLLIDTDLPADMNQPIPNDKNHLHFGLGQTETEVELAPGTHTLQLLMADGRHIPQDPPLYSKKITIHIRAGNAVAGAQ